MSETVLLKQYKKEDIPDINLREVLRYAGFKGDESTVDDTLMALIHEVISQAEKEITYKVVYVKSSKVLFNHESTNLNNLLKECDEYIMFGASLGIGIDRLIALNGRISPTKALLFQALGAERIEALCDKFCLDEEDRLSEGQVITARYSPGYGDLPIEIQKDFFRILDLNRKMGISLNESMLISPSKSVTAIMGIKSSDNCKNKKDWYKGKCENCLNTDCEYRGK